MAYFEYVGVLEDTIAEASGVSGGQVKDWLLLDRCWVADHAKELYAAMIKVTATVAAEATLVVKGGDLDFSKLIADGLVDGTSVMTKVRHVVAKRSRAVSACELGFTCVEVRHCMMCQRREDLGWER